jgi:riboflavin synthase
MFTGLIEETGRIKALNKEGSNVTFTISAKRVIEDVSIGDSIAVNGVCLTVTEFDKESFKVTAIAETLGLTNLGGLINGSLVNLERCLALGDRLGGHIVQGHVEAIGTVLEIVELDGSYEYFIEFPEAIRRYIIHKGSIALNGISLTVASLNARTLSVAIIPETLTKTNIKDWAVGTEINIETDMLAKYAENMLTQRL